MSDAVSLFHSVLRDAGLVPATVVADGTLHRCPVEGKPHGRDGAYILHPDRPASGWWQNHRTGESATWSAKTDTAMTPEEREAFHRRVELDRKAREEGQTAQWIEAAQEATAILGNASPASPSNPYLSRKGVRPVGNLRSEGALLLVPVLDGAGRVQSLQRIYPDGSKRFLTSGKKQGGFFPIRAESDDGPLFVCEGIATGLSVHEATGGTVLCAFDCGNLKHVATTARQKYPTREIVVCADDDRHQEGNPGLSKATDAAGSINGVLAVPRFPEGTGGTDFNDLAAVAGPDAVREQLAGAAKGDARGFLARIDLAAHRTARMIEREPPPLTWVFRHSLLTGTVGLLVGPPGAGKSTFLLQLAASVASGRPVFGDDFVPAQHGRVLALFCEEDARVLHHRTHRVMAGLADIPFFDTASVGDSFYAIPCAGQDMRLLESGPGETPHASAVFDDLLKLAKGIEGLALIILDPLSRLYGANENDNASATLFASLLERLATETGAAVLCSHHVSKGADRDAKRKFCLEAAMLPDALRGASAFTGAARWQCNLFPVPGDAAKGKIGDPDAEDGQYLAARVCKKNYGPPEQTFFLKRENGGVLVPVEAVAMPATDDDARAETWVLETIRAMAEEDRHVTKRDLANMSERKDAGLSKAAVQDAVDRLLFQDRLTLSEQKNRSGKRTQYVVLVEPAEPAEQTNFEPAGEPAGGEPAEPAGTGRKPLPVCNMLDSLEVENRQAREPAAHSAGFKKPMISTTDKPAEPAPPTGGGGEALDASSPPAPGARGSAKRESPLAGKEEYSGFPAEVEI